MIWATVSSWSYFCWLYRASPSLAAKNIINLISVLTIWWCPCVESSLVLLEDGVCYDQCVLLAKLYYLLPCFILYSKAKFACYSRCILTFYFCIPVPCNKKDIFWRVLVLEDLGGHHRKKAKIMASSPITSWQVDGETMEIVTESIFGAPKSLQMVTAAMKLEDSYSLE